MSPPPLDPDEVAKRLHGAASAAAADRRVPASLRLGVSRCAC